MVQFEGTILFVSHDRYFLNRVADHLLVVEPDRFRVIEGNYDTYLHLVRQGLAGRQPLAPAEEKKGEAVKPTKPPRPKRRYPYRAVSELEAEIIQRETRINELHAQLSEPEVLRNGQRVRDTQSEIAEQQAALKTLYDHWDEATELN